MGLQITDMIGERDIFLGFRLRELNEFDASGSERVDVGSDLCIGV